MSMWQVVVVEGSARDLRGFVAGFVAERRLDPESVVLGDDVGLERGSLGERLRALLHGGHHAVLAPQEVATPLEEAIARCDTGIVLRVVDRHPVTTATFAFAAEVFAREVSSAIRAALRDLPDGVRFAEHSEHEEAHAENKGVELYSPVHEYIYRVRGVVTGLPAGVTAGAWRIEAVRLEALHLAPA
jgi:hypothetical protein